MGGFRPGGGGSLRPDDPFDDPWGAEARAEAFEEFSEATITPSEEMLAMLLDYADDFRRRHALPADHPVYVATTQKARSLIGETLPAPLRWGVATKAAS